MSGRDDILVSVLFRPDDRSIQVPAGASILQAAQGAGIYVNSVCGGDGTCGKCKVKVVSGEVEAPDTDLLSEGERQQGYVLGCQARLQSDIVVEVPEAARLGREAILSGETEYADSAADPLVRKLCLKLDPPTLENNLADYERICSALRREYGIEEPETGLCALRRVHHAVRQGDWTVTAAVAKCGHVWHLIDIEPGDTTESSYGIAVDVGTTTVAVQLIDLHAGRTKDAEAKYNSQIQYGEDYIRRIMYVEEHNAPDEMQRLVVRDINELTEQLCRRNGLQSDSLLAATCAGNTTMLHLLLGLDPTGIRKSPYVPTAASLPVLMAADIGLTINPCAHLYPLPCVGAYVGADITAGALATKLHESDENVLFIDVGTNGEVVFGNREWMVCCSASAGPAFEGAGVKCGMRAVRGAIEGLQIGSDGSVRAETVGNAAPLGLCGSGLIDAVAQMFLAGAIDRTGAFDGSFPGGRLREIDETPEFILVPREESGTDEDIVITQIDIENLLRSKAAIYAAVSVLLKSVEMSPVDVDALYLAGGFGNSLNASSAATLGLIPDVPLDRIHFVGNTSVRGAAQSLLEAGALETVQSIAQMMTYFDLIAYPNYMDEFVSAMFVPHTDVEKFPSVARAVMAS